MIFDLETQNEVGHNRFMTEVNLRQGRSKRIVEYSASPPTRTVDAARAGESSERHYGERVVIHRIDYTDGSFWERPAN